MDRSRLLQLLSAVSGGLAAVLGLLGILLLLSGRTGLMGGCSALTPVGWTVPLLSGAVIGAVTWILLGQETLSDDPSGGSASTCPSCSTSVMSEWRLCPHCGHRLDEVTARTSDQRA